ncbi:MAG: hypothetical protein WAM73_12020 [Desulfobacterales bacterium]
MLQGQESWVQPFKPMAFEGLFLFADSAIYRAEEKKKNDIMDGIRNADLHSLFCHQRFFSEYPRNG